MGPLTDPDNHMVCWIRLDSHKITAHDGDDVIVNGKDESGVNGGVDQPHQILLASGNSRVVLESISGASGITSQAVQ